MDFIEGENLANILSHSGYLREDECLTWIKQVCDALIYLHEQHEPIIHRDIKPQNIIITPKNEAILVDFGISKIVDPKLTSVLSIRALTPGYAPPEQYGMSKTDERTDIYAIGATLYTLLTNKRPSDSYGCLLGQENFILPSQINPNINSSLEKIVLMAMELQPSRRYQSVREFQLALFPITQPIPITPDPATKINDPQYEFFLAVGKPILTGAGLLVIFFMFMFFLFALSALSGK